MVSSGSKIMGRAARDGDRNVPGWPRVPRVVRESIAGARAEFSAAHSTVCHAPAPAELLLWVKAMGKLDYTRQREACADPVIAAGMQQQNRSVVLA